MPKKVSVYNNFSGGLCNAQESELLKDNEVYSAVNVVFDAAGSIRNMGSGVTFTSYVPTDTLIMAEGYQQLFFFSNDLSINSSKNFLALVAHSDPNAASSYKESHCLILSENMTPYLPWIQLCVTTVNNSPEGHFYFADGGLRICDWANATQSSAKVWEYGNSRHFTGTSYGIYNNVYSVRDSMPYKPWRGIVEASEFGVAVRSTTDGGSGLTRLKYSMPASLVTKLVTGGVTTCFVLYASTSGIATISVADSSTVVTMLHNATPCAWPSTTSPGYVYPPRGAGFTINVYELTDAGAIDSGKYVFGQSFVWKGGQESTVRQFDQSTTAAWALKLADDISSIIVRVKATAPYNAGIEGGRIYMKNIDADDPLWYHIIDISFEHGIKAAGSESFTQWDAVRSLETALIAVGSVSNNSLFTEQVKVFSLLDTYESLNGYDESDLIQSTKGIHFKSAVIVNRTAYLGNVRHSDQNFPDTVLKSLPNKFDTFLRNRKIDVVTADGEDIITMATFANSILQFKQRTLYIIDVSREIDSLQGKYEFRGVLYHYHVVTTAFGVFWFNDYGVFWYTGEQIIDMFMDFDAPTRRKISLTSWRAFVVNESNAGYPELVIQFSAKTKKLIIMTTGQETGDIDNDEDKEGCMVFSLDSLTWSFGDRRYSSGNSARWSAAGTNWNGDAIIVSQTEVTSGAKFKFHKWQDAPAATTAVKIITKRYMLGESPAVNCNFYALHVESVQGTRMSIEWDTDGAASLNKVFSSSKRTLTSGATIKNDIFNVAATPSQFKNVNSMQFKIFNQIYDAVGVAAFELHNLSLVYRPKGLRWKGNIT